MYNWDFLSELYAASISSSLQQKSKSVHTMRSEKAPYFGGIDENNYVGFFQRLRI
jgi:hypothetical protein